MHHSPRHNRWVGIGFATLAVRLLAEPEFKGADPADWKLPSEPFTLREDGGLAAVRENCLLCHSTEYISTQPPLKRTQWEAEVTKMRVKFAAPIPTNAVPGLVDYLVRNYGTTNR